MPVFSDGLVAHLDCLFWLSALTQVQIVRSHNVVKKSVKPGGKEKLFSSCVLIHLFAEQHRGD